jgi:ACR3 family arsenite transporter
VLTELVVCTLIGLHFHSAFVALKATLPYAIFLILLQPMFAIDLQQIWERGLKGHLRFLAIVAAFYLAAMPAVTFLLVEAWKALLPPETWPLLAGAVIVELAPVAMPAPAFTAMAGGDIGLSVLSVILTFLAAPVAMPAYTLLMLHKVVPIPAQRLVNSIVLYIILPFIVGQLLRSYIKARNKPYGEIAVRESLARVNTALAVVSCLSLYWLVGVVFGVAAPTVAKLGTQLTLAVTLLVAFTWLRFAIAAAVNRALSLPWSEAVAVLFAASSNGALGSALAVSVLGPEAGAGAVIAGPVIMFLSMIILLRLLLRRKEHHRAAGGAAETSSA